ncbi:YihY/virulence factor BrkB family protein [Polyangium jinanense]|uniref:YihY/virulence factor BrkB family protein n=1 Tax=Polyangium jinanense TaxID=2829994 RepID=A0A9X3XAD1_9BACT|nr:YihY/virulence factor BrkB family protein [Polyangium jinanense]MDC3957174.1 YihY/virulence factor BrkB family protein [Polyangium jinanense]MDC3986669.1 YihY/virulence factor BrkB family protein [Polyangium jinanense]
MPLSRLIRPGVGFRQFIKDLYKEIREDQVSTGAAALAYFLMLSIFPAAIFLLSLLPYLPIPGLESAITDLLREAMPTQAAELFTSTVDRVLSERRGGLLSVGLLGTLWAASNGLNAIIGQLNVTYDVRETRPFWKTRGMSVLLVLLFGALVVTALGLIIFGGILQREVAELIGWSGALLKLFSAFRWLVILGFLLTAFAVVYYFGPNVEQRFRFITPGAVLGVGVLILAALGFRFYVENFGKYEATYGSLGAVIVLLLWLYVAGLVILFGSEVNSLLEHYAEGGKRKGERQLPSSNA